MLKDRNMNITDKQKIEFLIDLAKEDFNQGSEYYAYKSKRGKWHFGHANVYEIQHGRGSETIVSDSILELLMKRSHLRA